MPEIQPRDRIGQFATKPTSAPHVALGETRPLTADERVPFEQRIAELREEEHSPDTPLHVKRELREQIREVRARINAGTGPHTEAMVAVRAVPVNVPSTVDGRTVIGEGALSYVSRTPMDGAREVVFDDGTTTQVGEHRIVRDLPPLPEGPSTEVISVSDVRPGMFICDEDDNGPTYRQVLSVYPYESIMEGFAKRIDVVFADNPEGCSTYQNVPVSVVAV